MENYFLENYRRSSQIDIQNFLDKRSGNIYQAKLRRLEKGYNYLTNTPIQNEEEYNMLRKNNDYFVSKIMFNGLNNNIDRDTIEEYIVANDENISSLTFPNKYFNENESRSIISTYGVEPKEIMKNKKETIYMINIKPDFTRYFTRQISRYGDFITYYY